MPATPFVTANPGLTPRRPAPWSVSWRRLGAALGISAAVLLAALARFCPDTTFGPSLLAGDMGMIARAPVMVNLLHHPLTLLAAPAGDAASNALRWRLLWPALGHILGISSYHYLLMARIGSGMLLGAGVVVLLCYGRDCGRAMAGGILLACSAAFMVGADWICLDPLLLSLCVGFVFGNETLSVVAGLAMPWADERAVLMLLPMMALRATVRPAERGGLWGGIAGACIYCAVRLIAMVMGESSLHVQVAFQARGNYPILKGWYFAFGAGWIVVVWGMLSTLAALWARSRWVAAGSAAALAAGIWSVGFFAADTTRSIAICAPFLLAGILRLPRWALAGLAVLVLVLPAGVYIGSQHKLYHSFLSW